MLRAKVSAVLQRVSPRDLESPEARERFLHELPDWGHGSSSLADFALDFGIKTLYLFHHEPSHDDAKVEETGRTAQWYADHNHPGVLRVSVAREGREDQVV